MFTGIIEEIGSVHALEMSGSHARLNIAAQRILDDIKIGDSIAVNGACLTVTQLLPAGFWADVSQETLAMTTLKLLKPGTRVNLERALRLIDRLGGHFVQGHVDATAKIFGIQAESETFRLTVSVPANIRQYIVRKGSIAIDGISLTINECDTSSFTCMIIPHTIQHTTLQLKHPGDLVNLESDVIGRYIEKLMAFQQATSPGPRALDEDFLREHGWM
jgi:riboflavin synthase